MILMHYVAYDNAKQRHLLHLINMVNVSALKEAATKLRHGMPCEVLALCALETANSNAAETIMNQMGGHHCHVDIVFEDGVTWLARFRLVNGPTLPPIHVASYVFNSETATIYVLANTNVRAPRVFDYALKNDSDNQVGLTYFIMEKLPGTMLDWNAASEVQKTKIIEQIADISLELEGHLYQNMGSSFIEQSNGDTSIRGLAHPSLFESADTGPLGPFASAQGALPAIIHLELSSSAQARSLLCQ